MFRSLEQAPVAKLAGAAIRVGWFLCHLYPLAGPIILPVLGCPVWASERFMGGVLSRFPTTASNLSLSTFISRLQFSAILISR